MFWVGNKGTFTKNVYSILSEKTQCVQLAMTKAKAKSVMVFLLARKCGFRATALVKVSVIQISNVYK